MKPSFLKSLDGVLYHAACQIASRGLKPSLTNPSSEILILRPGGLGDLICADIALGELGLDPRRFTWLIEQRSQPWAQYRSLPHLCYDVNPLKTLKQIRARYPLVINTEQFFGLAEAYALLAVARSGRIASFQTNRASAWSAITLPYDWRSEHETTAFARLFAKALSHSQQEKPRLPRPRLYPSSALPLVLIAGRQSPSRRLDLETWVNLISAWHNQRAFLIAAAPEDAAFADEIAHCFAGLAQRFTGGFPDLCEQIARSQEVFTMDGGAVHIASFFGVPTLALFTSGRDRKWSPLGEGSRIIRRRDLPCQPCTKFGQVPPCPHQYACLKVETLLPENIRFNETT